jgi:glycosyltransferase involved in cell wall biosynthesis
MLAGLAAYQPGVRFRFCFRPHRYLRAGDLPLAPNARRCLLAGPFGSGGADLFHGLNQRLPGARLRRPVATFHDLFVITGEYSTPEFRARFTAQARDAAARAEAIITVSAFTKGQVVSLLDVDASRVTVVHHGIRKLEYPPVAREKIVLNVGAIQTRKNIAGLVEAFETLPPDWRLVLAGSSGFGADVILARIERSPARDRIAVTGYIDTAQLAGWYARASIFAFPSLDEGFGMPVLEAMAAGTPVVASNSSALPEVAGDAAVLVDTGEAEALGRALRDIAGNLSLREELAERGRGRARLFTWEKAVSETWNVYRGVLG